MSWRTARNVNPQFSDRSQNPADADDRCRHRDQSLSFALVVYQISLFKGGVPRLPGRSEKKYRVVPSFDSHGEPSFDVLSTGIPRFVGTDHASDNACLVEVQISISPTPPARFDVMNASRPSFLMKILVSRPRLLKSETRIAGIPGRGKPCPRNGLL